MSGQLETQVERFSRNEDRINKWVNDEQGYITENGQHVDSLPALLMDVKKNSGKFSFKTLADFNSKKSELPLNCVVTILEPGANYGDNDWDGVTLTPSPFDPIRQSVTQSSTNLNDKLSTLLRLERVNPNIMSLANIEIGKCLSLDGTATVNHADWSVSDFLPVIPGDVIQFKLHGNNTSPNIVFYKEDKTVHTVGYTGTTVRGGQVGLQYTVPEGSRYFRFAYRTSYLSQSFVKLLYTKKPDSYTKIKYILDVLLEQTNLLTGVEFTLNTYIRNNVLITASSWKVSDFIPVDEHQTYTSNINGTSSGSLPETMDLGVHFYDANKNLLAIGKQLLPNFEFNTPAECKFIRINMLSANVQNPNPYLVRGDFYAVGRLQGFVTDIMRQLGVLKKFNVFDVYSVIVGSYINATGTSANSGNWSRTVFIPVNPSDTLDYSCYASSSVSIISEYNENQEYIGSPVIGSGSPGFSQGEYTVPEGVSFIVLSYYNQNPAEFLLTTYSGDSGGGSGGTPSTQSRYTGKVWLTMGTSIVDSLSTSYTYPKWVREHYNMTHYEHAISGSRARSSLSRSPSNLDSRILSSDIITIDHGTNDYKIETPLGAITDEPTLASLLKDPLYRSNDNKDGTFYGDLKGVIEYIYSIKASARIMLVTPIKRTQTAATGTHINSLGHTLEDYSNAVKEIAKYYSLPLLDNFNESGFNIKTIPNWTADGLHPTEWAQKNIMANRVIGFFESQ